MYSIWRIFVARGSATRPDQASLLKQDTNPRWQKMRKICYPLNYGEHLQAHNCFITDYNVKLEFYKIVAFTKLKYENMNEMGYKLSHFALFFSS
jgi:hypothetical protein